jgi:protein-S-isoprenylcysteine O-methyltransferase Ste14
MKKILFPIYGIIAYVIFFATYCYAVGFVTNILVPTGLDSKPTSSLGYAILLNVGLLVLFALQHSVMARPAFKKRWTTIVPEPLERSTYVLLSSLCMILLFIYWQPMGGVVWSVDSEIAYLTLTGISLLGFGIVLVSTFLINHFDLFGLRQVWLFFIGKPYTQLPFKTPFFYKYVRHPLYLGWMIAFWAAPTMTVAHFLFAAICTGYMLTAIRFEERDLVQAFGDQYIKYKQKAPMLIPFAHKNKTGIETSSPSGHATIED